MGKKKKKDRSVVSFHVALVRERPDRVCVCLLQVNIRFRDRAHAHRVL